MRSPLPPSRGVRRSAIAPLLVAVVLALAGSAHAQDDGAYRATIADAVAEFEAQNYLEARALFLRAHGMKPSARTLRGLGAASFELRHYAETVSYLDAALASRDKPLDGALRSETERLRERARSFVAELRVALEPREARVLVDGQPALLDATGASIWLDIGKHRLSFQADGYLPEQGSYTAEGGTTGAWTIVLEPASAPKPARGEQTRAPAAPGSDEPRPSATPPGLPARSSKKRLLVGSLLGGLGLASLGGSGWLFAAHVEDGRHVRVRGRDDIAAQSRWKDSRVPPLVLVGAGSALLTASAATLSDLVPRRHRRWLSPLLLAAGTGALAGGLVGISRGSSCDAHDPGGIRGCVIASERRDRGLLVAFVALPLLTIPTLHTLDWLRGR